MSKKRVYIFLAFIILLSLWAGIFCFPQPFNKGIDYLNKKTSWHLPHFWNKPFVLGLDLQGGSYLVYDADLSKVLQVDRADKMEGLRDIIEKRVNNWGVVEPVIQVEGKRLIVELAGVKDINKAIDMIGKTPWLEFKEQTSKEEQQEIIQQLPEETMSQLIKQIKENTGNEVTKDKILDYTSLNLFKTTGLTGEYLKNAELTFEPNTNDPQVLLHFNKEGTKLLADITERNVDKPLAIYLDDKSIIDTDGDGKITDQDLYAPTIQEKIPDGNAIIKGNMNTKEAQTIVKRLNSGALPVPIGEPIAQHKIGPSLGGISLEKSLGAGILGFLAIILFLILFYKIPGFLAALSLIVYVLLSLSVFKLKPITLSLAGIGGFLLSIGIAVDANVLIFSRMREELKEGKNFSIALTRGFSRAWPSIRDGNLTTLIVAVIMFWLGSGFIQGFSTTLILGIFVSLFSALFVTRIFMEVFKNTKLEKVKQLWR